MDPYIGISYFKNEVLVMDISQMRKINEMTRVLQQHRIAPDAQAAYAQSEAFFLHTNDRMSPQEPQVILEHPQEQFSGTEVSLGVMHENHERLENFERKTQEKIVSLEDDVAHIINKVNELIQVMKSLEEKQDQVQHILQNAQQQPVQQTFTQASTPQQTLVQAPAAQTAAPAAAPEARQKSQRVGDFKQ